MHAVSRSLFTNRIKGALRRLTNHGLANTGAHDPEATYRKSLNYHVAALAFSPSRPRFRVVVTVDASTAPADSGGLERAIESVLRQAYDNWELVLVVPSAWDAAALEHLRRGRHGDVIRRAQVLRHGQALPDAHFDYLVVLDDTTLLTPFCLAVVLRDLRAQSHAPDLLYGDRAWIDPGSSQVVAALRPGWSPRLLASYRYLAHPLFFRSDWLRQAGLLGSALDPGFEWRWLESDPLRVGSGRRVPQFLGVSSTAPPSVTASTADEDAGPVRDAAVIIPTRDQPHLLRRALATLREAEPESDLDVMVVDNRSSQPDAIAAIARDRGARVLRFDHPFNYSAINNWAVAQTDRRLVVLMNNDVEVRARHTLARMARHALDPAIGAVGCRLLYDDGSVQHGGVLLSRTFLANHFFRGQEGPPGPATDLVDRDREVSAVTAAFLMIDRTKLLAVGGFDEVTYPIGYSDVDLCLRLGRAGLQNFYVGSVAHAHRECQSRGWADESFERSALQRTFAAELDDPFFHPEARSLDFRVNGNLDHLYASIRPLVTADA